MATTFDYPYAKPKHTRLVKYAALAVAAGLLVEGLILLAPRFSCDRRLHTPEADHLRNVAFQISENFRHKAEFRECTENDMPEILSNVRLAEKTRNNAHGPDKSISPDDVAMIVAYTRLCEGKYGVPALLQQGKVSVESGWGREIGDKDIGLWQINPVSVKDMNTPCRMRSVNRHMREWGLSVFDENLGRICKDGRWVDMDTIWYSPEVRARLTSPESAELACWVFISKIIDLDLRTPPNRLSFGQMMAAVGSYNIRPKASAAAVSRKDSIKAFQNKFEEEKRKFIKQNIKKKGKKHSALTQEQLNSASRSAEDYAETAEQKSFRDRFIRARNASMKYALKVLERALALGYSPPPI